MNRMIRLSPVLFLLSASLVHALTDQERVMELAKLLPAGKTLKAVWTAFRTNTDRSIRRLSSADGKLVDIVPGGNVGMANLTYDGSRIIYIKNESEVWIANWDGSGVSRIGDCQESLRYYRDRAANTDWAIGSTTRFNIDNPSQRVVIWNGSPMFSISDITPLTLSRDGKYCGGHFGHPFWGVGLVPNTVVYRETNEANGSCFATIAPDNTGDMIMQDGPHVNLMIKNTTGATIASYNISAPILAYAAANSLRNNSASVKYEDAKWGNSRDYAITFMWATKANPWFIRLSDLKFTYFDVYSTFPSYYGYGRPDFVILPEDAGTGVIEQGCARHGLTTPAHRSSDRTYRLDGRVIGSPNACAAGIRGARGFTISGVDGNLRPVLVP